MGAHQILLPGAVVVAADEQFVADGGIPIAEESASLDPHGLDGVVVAVEVVHLLAAHEPAAAAGARPIAVEIGDALVNFGPLVDAGAEESDDAGGGAREAGAAAEGLIAEATRLRILAALDVGGAIVG